MDRSKVRHKGHIAPYLGSASSAVILDIHPHFLQELPSHATMIVMEFDPHSLNQIIQRIQQQMRCPQCGEKIPVDFASVRLTGDDFVLLQLKCAVCDAYIVLHASLQGVKGAAQTAKDEKDSGLNASSSLCLKDTEVESLRSAIQGSEGSFEKLFKA